jgi:formylglycine-generating enzyme required for sulfatase activity
MLCVFVVFTLTGCERRAERAADERASASPMKKIPGGEFSMGSGDNESYEHEFPRHRVAVKDFWLDETEVTNKQFDEFVKATGYVTVAERKPAWEELQKQLPPGTPPPPDSILVPGALVFVAPKEFVPLYDYSLWWKWTPGANWKHPDGPGSSIDISGELPVVQIAFEDAQAYCKWMGKRLPTEAEWEFASHGGDGETRFAWGDEATVDGKFMANTFQGSFPVTNTAEDGYSGVAPVKRYAPNGYGLYDMIGNVWEWTSDWYDVRHFTECAARGTVEDPQGPATTFDPQDPYAMKRVTKGGSYLCAPNYCSNYRPAARQSTAFDSGASNLGFRCAR